MTRGRGRTERDRSPARRLPRLPVIAGVAGLAALAAYLAGEGAPAGPPAEPEPAVWSEGRVRVEVLNLGGVSGMAREATVLLRRSGFDVVSFGNAPAFDPDRASAVVDRVGRRHVAEAVAAALGIDDVVSEPDPNLYVEVTVLLGQEWRGLRTGPLREGGDRPEWWDPWRWIEPSPAPDETNTAPRGAHR